MLLEPVAGQVARFPDKAALVADDGVSVSYSRLWAQSGELAVRVLTALSDRGECSTNAETMVGACITGSRGAVYATLAVLRAGCVLVPMAPTWPVSRIAHVIQKCKITTIVVDSHAKKSFHLIDAGYEGTIVHTDQVGDLSATCNVPWPPPCRLAYVIFSSGTTGQPKAITNEHRAAATYLDWFNQYYEVTPSDVLVHTLAYTMEGSIGQILCALRAGASLCVPSQRFLEDTNQLRRTIDECGVTIVNLYPTLLAAFMQHHSFPASVRVVTSAGEVLHTSQVSAFYSHGCANPNAVLTNEYGPTECSIGATVYRCPRRWTGRTPHTVPIVRMCMCAAFHPDSTARPTIKNKSEQVSECNTVQGGPLDDSRRVYILDGDLQPVDPGQPGEIYLGGAGLARGYLDDDLTQRMFLPDPFQPGGRVYRTGDRACWLLDGNVCFLGRLDRQVLHAACRCMLHVPRVDPAGEAARESYRARWRRSFAERAGRSLRLRCVQRVRMCEERPAHRVCDSGRCEWRAAP